MGANYYLVPEPCETCGRSGEPLHIGKSSAGWSFSLHVGDDEHDDIPRHAYPVDDSDHNIQYVTSPPGGGEEDTKWSGSDACGTRSRPFLVLL